MGTLLIDAHNSIMGIPLQTENRFSVILLTVLPKESHVVGKNANGRQLDLVQK